MAAWTNSDWIMIWNDDAVMKEQHWDEKIRQHDGQFKCLAFDTHNHHPYSIFPVIPIDWYRLLGTLSPHQMIDAVVSQVSYMLDIMERTSIKVDHERFDLVDGEKDDTYSQRVMLEGNPADPRDLNHVNHRNLRYLMSDRLAWYLQKQGHDMTWWKAVKTGQQDPWVKMRANDPNYQTTSGTKPA
jgi:hypothetical protein